LPASGRQSVGITREKYWEEEDVDDDLDDLDDLDDDFDAPAVGGPPRPSVAPYLAASSGRGAVGMAPLYPPTGHPPLGPPPGMWTPMMPPAMQMGYPPPGYGAHPQVGPMSSKEELIDRVKKLQGEYGDSVCDYWHSMCAQTRINKFNPSLHAPAFLIDFLNFVEPIVALINSLVKLVKAAKASGREIEKAWETVCNKQGGGMRDPRRQSIQFLEAFLDDVRRGAYGQAGKAWAQANLHQWAPPLSATARQVAGRGPIVGSVPMHASESGKADLVAECKQVQAHSEDMKQAWQDFCDAKGGGVRNPAKHDAAFLTAFLTGAAVVTAPVSRGSEFDRLVDEIKGKHKFSAKILKSWHDYCEVEGTGMRDPRHYDTEFLQNFLTCLSDGVFGEIVRDEEHKRLVKELCQKKSEDPAIHKRWDLFCDLNGLSFRDPIRHESDFLLRFLYRMESWVEGDKIETEEGLLGPKPGPEKTGANIVGRLNGGGAGKDVGHEVVEGAEGSEENLAEDDEASAGEDGACEREDDEDEGEEPAEGEEDTEGKLPLFIGGMPEEATEADLEEYFSQFGLILQAKVVFNSKMSKSLRYGFVTLTSVDGSHEEVLNREHEILGKAVDVKRNDKRRDAKAEADTARQKPKHNGGTEQSQKRARRRVRARRR